ncbi:DUF3575 domain-containing protein [Alistipes communis]|uniref:DUF3575 domain-containing protein n=1 Tax=Alistipes communis TaxID=2585118 RepID=UPI00189A4652|nr:DUF3575 domain-containing protein [Alistipes communis]
MFYSPYRNNDKAIEAATELIDAHREALVKREAVVRIRGFCDSYPTVGENLAAAKNHSNQVKSYFIVHAGMKEEYYRTSNKAFPYNGMKDIVALVGIKYLNAPTDRKDSVRQTPAAAIPPAVGRTGTTREDIAGIPEPATAETPVPEPEDDRSEEELSATAESIIAQPTREIAEYRRPVPLSIKTNLLYDAVLMPSLEFEYRFSERWSINVEGSMAWWHTDRRHVYYQLAQISPEARYWFKPQGPRKGHYVGLFIGGGWYDLENGGRGYKGEGEYAGFSYGYMFPVGKYFAMEAGVGVGFLHTDYEEYLPLDGHYVYQQSGRVDYFGPLKLKLTFVWNIGCWLDRKREGKR